MALRDRPLEQKRTSGIALRLPTPVDAMAVWRLIRSCKPLDENSLYCNLLQCDHFAGTCVAAEHMPDGAIIGWTSSYLLPDDATTLFIWQVAVDARFQGRGIAKQMLSELLQRPPCTKVRRLQTTITTHNTASWELFRSFAHSQGGELQRTPYFRDDIHFHGAHETEHLASITLAQKAQRASAAGGHARTNIRVKETP